LVGLVIALLLYTEALILGAAGHIVLTPANQLMVMGAERERERDALVYFFDLDKRRKNKPNKRNGL
jgi:hypothetical protein